MTSICSSRSLKCLTISLAFSAVVGFGVQARGQSAPAVHVGSVKITGIPDDWTHHHVLFANPGTEQDAVKSGHDVQWQKVVNEPRYVIQQLKKNLPVQGPAAADAEYRARWISEATGDARPAFGFGPHYGPAKRPVGDSDIQRDWSMTSGGAGGLLPNQYPAKYGFLSTSPESCNDFIVFPTGIVGSSTQATLVAYNDLYKTTCGSTVPGVLLSINTGGLANTSPVLSLDGTQAAYVQTTGSGSVTATLNSTAAFTVTSGTLTTNDVGSVVSGTGIPVGDTIATVTSSTTGTLTVAASATRSSTLTITGIAQLVLLKIGTGGGTAVGGPVSPTATTPANYRTCTGPCYTTFNFYNATAGTAPGDSNSAPFYVYESTSGDPDILYVGDNLGYVHKFTGVFNGTPPAEVTTGWPAHASTETSPILNSPVYDSVSGNIFVGDASGYLHQFAVGTTPGTVNASGRLAYNTGGLVDPPDIDNTSGTSYVYQFVGYSDDTTHDRPSYINWFTAATTLTGFGNSVWFPNNSTATRPAGTSTVQYAGTFDNTYFTGAGNTGNIYSCADGVMYQIPLATISATTPTVHTFSTPTSAAAACSPVTEFYTGSTDWIFTSVAANGNATVIPSCSGPCVYNYNVTTSTGTTGAPVDGLSATGGTSGIVIDNAASGGGSEIYFTSQGSETCNGNGSVGSGTGSCAVQATQADLQ
jgi:hypothetical protein